jgi:hypothetical protein
LGNKNTSALVNDAGVCRRSCKYSDHFLVVAKLAMPKTRKKRQNTLHKQERGETVEVPLLREGILWNLSWGKTKER